MAFNYSPKIVRDSSLVLCLDAANPNSFVSGGTVWRDISKGGNNGTLIGGVTYNSSNNGSLVFNGSTGYIDLGYKPIINTATTFTLNVWVNTRTTAEQVIFSTVNATPNLGWIVEIYQSKFLMQVFPSASYTQSPKILSINTWYNITTTYNNGSIIYYINGVQDGTASYTFTPSLNSIYISRYTAGILFFNGSIPNVAFYNRVLSSTEVLQNYNALKGRYNLR